MPKLRLILAVVLLYAIATLWVKDRWAVCGLEAAVFLCSGWTLLRLVKRRTQASVAAVPVLLAGLSLWGVGQLLLRWTVVPAETGDAVLYWLAAACLAWLGLETCRDPESRTGFLELLLCVGSSVCLLGLIQLFTSHGRVFWLFPSGFDSEVIGPFVSRNQYAAMVEVLLPVALVMAFRHRRKGNLYLILAASLVASVIASGSRAGTAIVLSEAVLVLVLLVRSGSVRFGAKWIAFVGLVLTFTCIVGYQYAWNRFRDSQDPFEYRREFVESSVAMIRAEPLHGFGFGTWPAAYREYALIDTGSLVNHSHNEWLQWAAEGGLPALGLMLAVFALTTPVAIRSIWGIGVPAVFLHGLVDYPFLRLGLAAWIFVFLGALAGYGRDRKSAPGKAAHPPRVGPHSVVALLVLLPILLFATYAAFQNAGADALYRQGTSEAIARAASLRPDRAEYQFAWAQMDREHSIQHLQRTIALNPFLTDAQIQLASQMESTGDTRGSEAILLQLARRDRLYAPAWALTNFYFRAGLPGPFWTWAHVASQTSPGGLRPLFALCLARTNDSAAVLDRVVAPRRVAEREYAEFLLERDRISDAHQVALRLAANATVSDRDCLLGYVDRALDDRRFEEAADIWNRLCLSRLVPYAPSLPGALVNGEFNQTILDHGFDWRAGPPGCALAAQTNTDGAALELFLQGNRPESCEIYHQFLRLAAGGQYEMRFQYRTTDLPDSTGVRWSLGTGQEYELPAAAEWSESIWRWRTPDAAARLALSYRRPPGSTRQQGTVLLRRVHLQAQAGGDKR